jgi:hypothetical protein
VAAQAEGEHFGACSPAPMRIHDAEVIARDVCYWPKADMSECSAHVCFWGKADMQFYGCLLSRSLLGVKRTWVGALHMSAFDPKRTCHRNPAFGSPNPGLCNRIATDLEIHVYSRQTLCVSNKCAGILSFFYQS